MACRGSGGWIGETVCRALPGRYGIGVKVNAVYMSQYQKVPYNRIKEHFLDQMQMPVSAGSIVNFNKDAFARLEFFELWVKKELASSAVIHADETGINMGAAQETEKTVR